MELFGFNFDDILWWHWWAFAIMLFVLEVLTMGFFFLWLGVSGLVVGAIYMLAPGMPWQIQFTLWALFSAIGALGWRIYKKGNPNPIKSDEPLLNRRGEQYVDRVFTLEEPIENGFGKVKVDDSIWKVEASEDYPAGTKIKVISVEGTILQVEKA